MLPFPQREVELHRQPRFVAMLLGSTVVTWVIFTRPFVVEALGINLPVLKVYTPMFLAAQLVPILFGAAIATEPRWAWLRVTSLMTATIGGLVYGATSTLEVSAAWLFALPVLQIGARFRVHHSPALLGAFGVAAPILHLSFAPTVTSLSLGVAVLAGTLGMLGMYLLGRRADETASLAATEQLDRRQLDARQNLLSRVAVAMSVHDQLSGLLVGARVKLKRATAYAEVSDAVGALLSRTRALLDAGAPGSGDLLSSIREAVEAQGATFDLRLEQRRALTPDEAADVRDIASEACLNAARAGNGTVVQLHVVIDVDGVSMLCRAHGGSGPASGRGRGLRNMRLRSWARGGSFFFEAPGTESTLRVSWPKVGHRRKGALMLAAMAVGATGLALVNGHTLAVGTVIAIGAMAVMLGRHAHRLATRHVVEPRALTMQLVQEALAPTLAELEQAHTAESLPAAREALRELGSRFTRLLAELEREMLPLMPRLDAAPRTEAFFVFEPHHVGLLGWRFAVAQAATSAMLSTPLVVSLMNTPPFAYRVVNALAFGTGLAVTLTVRRWASVPWGAPLRSLTIGAFAFFGASSGAMSFDDLGPGWLLFVFVIFAIAQFPLHRAKRLLPVLAIVPLVTRLVFVPDASVTSLLLAAVAGVASAIVPWWFSRRREAIARLEEEETLDERELMARGAVVDGLATAMELHDGLGGEVLRLRLKLKKLAPWPDVTSSLERVQEKAAELLRAETRPLETLPDAMRAVAVAAGREVRVSVHGELDALDRSERADVWSIVRRFVLDAVELPPTPLDVSVGVSALGVEISLEASEALLAGEARPTRNARLRAWARGGTFVLATPTRARLRWAHRKPLPIRSSSGVMTLTMVGLTMSYCAASGQLLVSAIIGVLAALAAFVFVPLDARRDVLLRRLEALRQHEAVTGANAALSAARTRLGPRLDALAQASHRQSLADTADAARALGEALVETVRSLEESPLQALGPMNPVPVAPLR
ncbi:MAG: hypothetical protein JNM69_02390 [Archangium sp.]|nr:hypothetical protein [Archangium sp.]